MRKIKSRVVAYIMALALLLLGKDGTDIGQLRPVEVIRMHEKNGLLYLETDTGDLGWGMTVDEAVRKLKETTPGQIYLDTADYLLLEKGVEEYLKDVLPYLKKGMFVAYGSKKVDLQEAAGYLRIHRPTVTIGNGMNPRETLVLEGGRLILKNMEKNEK